MSPMSFPLSLPLYTPPFLSLSPQRNPVSPLGLELFEGDPELYRSLPLLSSLSPSLTTPSTLHPPLPPLSPQGAGSRSTESSRAPNPGPGLALLPQASLAVPLHHREAERWEAWEEKSKGGDDRGTNKGDEGGKRCVWSHS